MKSKKETKMQIGSFLKCGVKKIGMQYSTDRPITKPEDDLYQRADFAREIVKSISDLSKNECAVIGLYSPWGYGKTSCVNLVEKLLEEEGSSIKYIYIDAWAFNGNISDIQYEIITKLSESLNRESKDRKKRIRWDKAGTLFHKTFSRNKSITGNSAINLSGVSIGSVSFSISEILQSVTSAFENNKIKKQLTEEIKRSELKFIVCIDNIDRLEHKEINDIFRYVNRISNYDGISYLLPFDKKYIAKSLEEHLAKGINGYEYLEKIIQIPIDLPIIPQKNLDKVFGEKLNQLFNELGINIQSAEIDRFRMIYSYYGVNRYIRTPRDIVRMINAFKLMIPRKIGEVNIVDYIICEIMRIVDNDFYKHISSEKYLLIKGNNIFNNEYANDSDNEKKKEKLREIIAGSTIRENVLIQLFPNVKNILMNGSMPDSDKLRREKRIASEYYFDAYFSPIDFINNACDNDISKLMDSSGSSENIKFKLESVLRPENYKIVLKKISDRTSQIKDKKIFCECLLDVISIYPRQRCADLSLDIHEMTLFTIDDILKNEEFKNDIYIDLLTYNFGKKRYESIPYLIRQVILYSGKEDSGRGYPILNSEDLAKYKERALSIIRTMAVDDLIPIDTLGKDAFIYHFWQEFAGSEEIYSYTKKHIKTSDKAIDFMSQFLGVWSSIGGNDYKRGDFDKNSYDTIKKYVDTDRIYQLLLKDKKYSQLKSPKEDELISFMNSFAREGHDNLAKLGNEHTRQFREVVARRFFYYYEAEHELDKIN